MSSAPRPLPNPGRARTRNRFLAGALLLGCALAVGACKGDRGAPGQDGSPGTPVADLAGVNVDILGVSGGTAPNGAFRVGDRIRINYTVKQDDGTEIVPSKLTRASIMVSGPTSNYQRVIEPQADLGANSQRNGDGTYTYSFTVPIPATYLAPLNDTTNFTDGELTGQDLLSGTYTVGIEARMDVTIDGTVYRDVGNATIDFLFGTATTLEPRAMVTNANCNQCHANIQAHGGNRTRVENCVLCHTAGAEDKNVASVEGGTPDITIDFKVMIHKIHAGATLPSVVGMTTNSQGFRDYTVASKPYKIVGFNNSVHDFSNVRFPVWPSMTTPMPRDTGWATANQSKENLVRSGPVDCSKCHGDPDGAGPLPAPAQGDLIYSKPSRAACASCHDDWVPGLPYNSNTYTMTAQANDSNCTLCHPVTGDPFAVKDAHVHPLVDPTKATGVKFLVDAVTDVGGNNNGKLDPGEKVKVTFRVQNNAGATLAASSLSRIEVTLRGPTTNPQMVNYQRVAQAAFTGDGPYEFIMPENFFYVPVGTSTNAFPQQFQIPNFPVWAVSGAMPTLLRRTGLGAMSNLANPTVVTQNYIDVTPGTGGSFTNNPYIVIDDAGGSREYMRVQWRDGDRLWFGSRFRTGYKPNLTVAHGNGATVHVVNTASVPTASWSIVGATGIISETVEFGDGEILATYQADFVIPPVYPGALDDSPVIGNNWGDWTGLQIQPGTYVFDMHGARSFSVSPFGEATNYTDAAPSTSVQVLFGSATTPQTVSRTLGNVGCAACHNDIAFHGGSRRGYDTCIACHGSAGSENTLVYENQNTGHPLGTSVEFRAFLHEVHEPVFPAMPGGVANCALCHGADNTAWKNPIERNHPNQTVPARVWSNACGSCHTSNAVRAHLDANTSPTGYEACAICHGPNEAQAVEKMHKTR